MVHYCKLYYYKGIKGRRWRLEGPVYSFWAQDDVISRDELKAKGVEVIVHEPVLDEPDFFRSRVVNNLDAFKAEADLIVANRLTDEIGDVAEKVFTRDLFGAD